MKKKYTLYALLCSIFFFIASKSAYTQTSGDLIRERLRVIAEKLDSLLFVNRFESVETPCLYIDSADNAFATPSRTVINSDYRRQLTYGNIDTAGVKCLSNYYSRYIKFKVDSVSTETMSISGSVQATYSYPTSSLIQYLCYTYPYQNKENGYFAKMIHSPGRFCFYPENDKYRFYMVMTEKPYDKRDTIYGHLEISQEYFKPEAVPSYQLYFDQMSIHKGDRNNQIFLRFGSTNHRSEMIYFTRKVYDVLKYRKSTDNTKKSYALWLSNFLINPACVRCNLIYTPATLISGGFVLPNTQSNPPH